MKWKKWANLKMFLSKLKIAFDYAVEQYKIIRYNDDIEAQKFKKKLEYNFMFSVSVFKGFFDTPYVDVEVMTATKTILFTDETHKLVLEAKRIVYKYGFYLYSSNAPSGYVKVVMVPREVIGKVITDRCFSMSSTKEVARIVKEELV